MDPVLLRSSSLPMAPLPPLLLAPELSHMLSYCRPARCLALLATLLTRPSTQSPVLLDPLCQAGSFRPASALRTPVHSSGTVDSTVDLLGAAAAAVTDGGAPPVSLNAFLKNHTSEDNASFSEMMEEGKKRAREKVSFGMGSFEAEDGGVGSE